MFKYETDMALVVKDDKKCAVESKASSEIKVTVHIPENVHETIRQQKINRIYDILNPKISH